MKFHKMNFRFKELFFFAVFITIFVNDIFAKSVSDELASATKSFTLALQKAIGINDEVLFCPICIIIVFSLVIPGAKENTLMELKKTLGLVNVPDENIYQQVKTLIHSMRNEYLSSANRIFLASDVLLDPIYKTTVEQKIGSSVETLDFMNNPQSAIATINHWVETETKGKISSIVNKVDSATQLILVNAFYFKGIWKYKFDSALTKKEVFNSAKNPHTVDMMYIKNPKDSFYYKEDKKLGFKCIVLPYTKDGMSMTIVLPLPETNIQTLIKKLTLKKLDSIFKDLHNTKMGTIAIPKFKMNLSSKLNEPLIKMGMNTSFSNKADFSGITGNNNLKIDQVIQKTFVEFNEEGTVAAAATAVFIHTKSASIITRKVDFIANSSFIYILRKENYIFIYGVHY